MIAPRDLKQTHTYVILPLSRAAFDEIARKLKEAGYDREQIDEGQVTIDMFGIAVQVEEPDTDPKEQQ